jgi:hypothetical protein
MIYTKVGPRAVSKLFNTVLESPWDLSFHQGMELRIFGAYYSGASMAPSGYVDCRVSRSGDGGWVVVGYSVSDLTAAIYYMPYALCYLCRCPDLHPVQSQPLRTLKLPVPLYLRPSACGTPDAWVRRGWCGVRPRVGISKPTSLLRRRQWYLATAWVRGAEEYADRLGAALRLVCANLGRSGRGFFQTTTVKQPQWARAAVGLFFGCNPGRRPVAGKQPQQWFFVV